MGLKDRCHEALAEQLKKHKPNVEFDGKGYVKEVGYNLVDGVRLEDFEADLKEGAGQELEKIRAPHSSSALVVNTFARFKAKAVPLWLPSYGEQQVEAHFECKCPAGVKGNRAPPHLDFVAVGPSGVTAIESKLTEYLEPNTATFSDAYNRDIQDWRRFGAWFEAMNEVVANPALYRFLDVGQLIKHAFGLAGTFAGRPVTLVYLFWEPVNWRECKVFLDHRSEVARFAKSVRGDSLEFMAMPYSALWASWEARNDPPWLREHVRRLKQRYEVKM